jgi:hypothetical protein
MKYTSLAVLATLGLLAGCGGGGSSNPLNPASSYGYFRFVNGSADAGSVDVYVDGQKVVTGATYGTIGAYQKFGVGAHTIAIDANGTTTAIAGISSSVLSQSVNAGQYVSLVLVGEEHPTASGDTPNLLAFNDQTYSTGSGGFAVNFHNAAPITASGTTQLSIADSSANSSVGSALNVAGLTQPTGITNTFVGAGLATTFTATATASGIPAATLTPSQIDPSGCAANTLPCNSGNLSIYYIDGPAASSSPSSTTLPAAISSSSKAGMTAIFDANGT